MAFWFGKKELEVEGKEFALLQELFLQAIKARLNPDCVEVDIRLLKELQGMIKKGEWDIAKRELEGLLEEEVVFEGEEEGSMMESEGFSFGFNVKMPSSPLGAFPFCARLHNGCTPPAHRASTSHPEMLNTFRIVQNRN